MRLSLIALAIVASNSGTTDDCRSHVKSTGFWREVVLGSKCNAKMAIPPWIARSGLS